MYYPGESTLLTRTGNIIHGMDHIVEVCELFDHEIDMELTVPGLEFNKISGIVRNHDDTPQVQGRMFDVPSHGGDFLERYAKLVEIHQNIPSELRKTALKGIAHMPLDSVWNFEESDIQKYARQHSPAAYARWQAFKQLDIHEERRPGASALELFIHFLMSEEVNKGNEGICIKTPDHLYRNTRSFDWMRLVPTIHIDIVVKQIYEGKGKFKGHAGGYTFDFNGHTCKVGTLKGINMAERLDMLNNPDKYIGRSATVEFKNYQVSGLPRQPRHKGWRYDK